MEICPRHQIPFETGAYCPGCVAVMALVENEKDQETPIATLGNYEIISELGRGGMGVVYLARQSGLNRRVALKLLPAGSLAGREFIHRFRREGELAASLHHPNIVRIFEAGEAEGELFYSMELITGGSLADWRDGKTQRPLDAAKLVRTLGHAVAHAHRHGILHRDLKPSNVLIDEDGRPKVADFGLARPLDASSELTVATQSFGSPAYMAPELIRDPHAAAPASDIYSLGAILYFLLSGRSPFVSASLDELLRQVRECEPPPPRLLDPSIPKDLQKICLKALDKSPAKRYATAQDLAEDLQRFIEGRPVLARPAGPVLKGYRLARRAPWLTAAVLSFVAALIGGIAGVAWYAKLANQRANEVARNASQLRIHLYASDIATASVALQRGDTLLANEVLSRWESIPREIDPRGFEWKLLKQESQPASHRLLDHREATVTDVALSPDGNRIAIADQSGKVLIRPSEGGKPLGALNWPAEDLAVIPERFGGGWVLGDPRGTIRWIDSQSHLIYQIEGRQSSIATALPRAVVSSTPRYHWWVKAGPATVVDWKSGERLREIPGEWRHAIISPDGRSVALAGLAGGLKLIDIGSGTERELPTPSNIWALSFSPDSRRLAAGTRSSAILWDLRNEDAPPVFLPHHLTVWMTAFSNDGEHLLTASSDRRVRIWKTEKPGAPPLTLSGHRSEVWCAAFSPDGKSVVAGGKDGDVLSWQISSPAPAREVLNHDDANPPLFSPDGTLLVTRDQDRSIIHQLRSNQHTTLPSGITVIGFSPDGRNLITVDRDGCSGNAPVTTPEAVRLNPTGGSEMPLRYLSTTSMGRWIVRVFTNGEILLENPADGKTLHHFQGPGPGMRHSVNGSPDGRWIAVCGDGSKSVELRNLVTGSTRRLSPPSSYYYVSSAFSPDGRLLAAGDLSGPIQVWEVESGRLLTSLPGHPEESSAVAFSPDGRTLASMGFHQDLKFWHVATWRELHAINIAEAAYHVVFSPDGSRLLITLGRAKNEFIEWFPAR